MAVHNGLPYLAAAIESILSQTFADFEFIIVDDASSDDSNSILHGYGDTRLTLLRNKRQIGLARTLNKAVARADGNYIARMDHDDISLPDRIERQVEYLEGNPKIDVVGTWAETIGPRPKQVWRPPLTHDEIRSELVFNPAFIHSSVMFRKQTFLKTRLRYNPDLNRAQDYDLWCKAEKRLRFANIGEVLLQYRVHPDQVGSIHSGEQRRTAEKIRMNQLSKLALRLQKNNEKLHHEISLWKFPGSINSLAKIKEWLQILSDGNARTKHLPITVFEITLSKRWYAACRQSVSNGMATWRVFKQSYFSRHVGLLDQARLWLKCASRQLGWKRTNVS
jgi:glycosyltransferase involved in cell wall biosynthesis